MPKYGLRYPITTYIFRTLLDTEYYIEVNKTPHIMLRLVNKILRAQ